MKKQKHHKKRPLPKQAQAAHKKREPRKAIISFRLRNSEVKALKDDMDRHPSTGIKSLKQFCRKLVVDYIGCALMYVNPTNRQTGNYRMAEVRCDMKDPAFLKALHRFLNSGNNGSSEENWVKLRAFILGFGWPERHTKQFRETLDDYERLQLARQVLRKMIKTL